MGRKSTKFVPVEDAPTGRLSDRTREVIALGLCGFCLYGLLCLATFRAADLDQLIPTGAGRNLGGTFGYYLAGGFTYVGTVTVQPAGDLFPGRKHRIAPQNADLLRAPQVLATGDFNGDGIVDIVAEAAQRTPYKIAVLLGRGNGAFETARLSDALGFDNVNSRSNDHIPKILRPRRLSRRGARV